MAKRTLTAILPNGEVATTSTTRNVTHAVAIHNQAREALCADGQVRFFPESWNVFRWSSAPETAVKELQRKGWPLTEISVIPVGA